MALSAAVVVFFLLRQESVTNSPVEVANELYSVTRVIDGDTIVAEIGGESETVRLIGIDAPETTGTKPQCFGTEATDEAKAVLTGKKIRLEGDTQSGNRDQYDRLLRYVFLEDGTNFNKLMISEGFAREYTFKGLPYRYLSEFEQAQKDAKTAKRGLWTACVK